MIIALYECFYLLTYLLTYLLIYLLTYLFTYLLTYLEIDLVMTVEVYEWHQCRWTS